MKEKVYLDSTIPSYIIANPSRDIILLGRQEVTRDWWETKRDLYELFISEIVLMEIEAGDPVYASKREELLQKIPLLENCEEIEKLAGEYMKHFNLPEKLFRDMYHIAFAVYYKMDFLMTWNFAHLANAHVKTQLRRYNQGKELDTPEICSPEELYEVL
jgi:predicted nucleic acid-binding protein